MNNELKIRTLRPIIQSAFSEDTGKAGDLTSIATLSESERGIAELKVKENGIIAGLPLLKPVFSFIDRDVRVNVLHQDGDSVASGMRVAEIKGRMRSLLLAERTALNFLQHLSGIATLTRQYADRVSHTKTKILDTRKTIPGLRALEKYAVRQGGGMNHRMGLYDMILIKDNHVDSNGGIEKTLTRCFRYLKKNGLSIRVEVETRSLDEVKAVLNFPVQRIMLDNMEIRTLKAAVRLINGRAETEASGNMNLDNIQSVAETGVDFISVGALTHSPKALDISMKIR